MGYYYFFFVLLISKGLSSPWGNLGSLQAILESIYTYAFTQKKEYWIYKYNNVSLCRQYNCFYELTLWVMLTYICMYMYVYSHAKYTYICIYTILKGLRIWILITVLYYTISENLLCCFCFNFVLFSLFNTCYTLNLISSLHLICKFSFKSCVCHGKNFELGGRKFEFKF